MCFKKPVSKSQVRLQKKIHLNILIITAASLPEEKLPHSSAAGIQVAGPNGGVIAGHNTGSLEKQRKTHESSWAQLSFHTGIGDVSANGLVTIFYIISLLFVHLLPVPYFSKSFYFLQFYLKLKIQKEREA